MVSISKPWSRAVLLAIAAVACARPRAQRDPPKEAGADDAAVAERAAASDAGSRSAASPFAIVAQGSLTLERVASGPVLGFESIEKPYVLSADGTVAPIDPLITLSAETLGQGWSLGRVTGLWPNHVYIEDANAAGRAGTLQKNVLFDAERGVATVTPLTGRHIAAAWPWVDGSLLGFEAEGPVGHLRDVSFARKGRFVLLGGSKSRPAPALPKGAAVDGRFVAYPSGRIFVIGGMQEDNDTVLDRARLWDFSDGVHARAVKLPTEIHTLVHGREESETLAFGGAGLVRFDGTAWAGVTAPFDGELKSVASSDDGSVWTVAGNTVWRADFPELRFTPVPLPAGFTPIQIAARSAADVWLVAKRGEDGYVLHTQAAKDPIKLADSLELARATLLKKDPAPFTMECKAPFFILGAEDEVSPRDVVAFAKTASKAFSGIPVLARIKAGKVYGVYGSIDPFHAPEEARATMAVFAAQKAKRPKLQLVCTIPSDPQTLP